MHAMGGTLLVVNQSSPSILVCGGGGGGVGNYNGAIFSIDFLEWGRTFSEFWGVGKFFIFTVSKCTRMFVL